MKFGLLFFEYTKVAQFVKDDLLLLVLDVTCITTCHEDLKTYLY